MSQIYSGLNMQIFNTPIDLYIEKYLYDNFPLLRPFQFISLSKLNEEYKQATNDERIRSNFPAFIREVNGILILNNIYQFKDLYGIDIIKQFKVSNYQRRLSAELYKEYLDTQYIPSIEYTLIDNWAKKLKIRHYFDLIEESSYRHKTIEEVTKEIKTDPLNLQKQPEESDEPFKVKDPASNMAIIMYCLGALQFFEGKPIEYIREVGFEIGLLGRYGLDPKNTEAKYNLKSIPEKKFSALQLLAYMYVAFKFIEPNLNTGLDFDKEFDAAKKLFDSTKE